jgi:hypothetical protein
LSASFLRDNGRKMVAAAGVCVQRLSLLRPGYRQSLRVEQTPTYARTDAYRAADALAIDNG